MKRKCSRCKEEKDINFFCITNKVKGILHRYCKPCVNECRKGYYKNSTKFKDNIVEYQNKNKEKIKSYRDVYTKTEKCKDSNKKSQNTERYRELKRQYHKTDKYKEIKKQYRNNNKGTINHHTAKRRAAILKATPPWLTVEHWEEIKELYQIAKDLQWLSEDELEVDHIIPLQGKNICGLHVPWNLQVIPRKANQRKGNKLLDNL